ncbi:MAG: hypothetical protein EZS28_023961 [Streblomastix strix]|uniref:Protein kinase domain-containing protein n=1 Tax=Streblomastix strix TaxID=222440 RepID=A0A5J4VDS1_9EUKA|nr:MAG: hypothetical protein EZS28_023961 [Streblomastix strix]
MEDLRLLQSQGFHILKTRPRCIWKVYSSSSTHNIIQVMLIYFRVYLISHPELGEIAAKVLSNEKFDANEWTVAGILNQEQDHICPYLIRYILAKQCEELTIILFEYENMKSLTNLVKNTKDSVSINLLQVILHQLLYGLKAIHSVNLIHRDIKV